jgi:hypothetical protein
MLVITNVSLPMFGAKKRQQSEEGEHPPHKVRSDEEMSDTVTAQASCLSGKNSGLEIDNQSHLRAVLPEVGDVFQSRSNGNLRRQAHLLSEKELRRDLEQHTAFKTYTALELLLDFAHPLAADQKSKKPAQDRCNALKDLQRKTEEPSYRLSASSKRYLQLVGLLDQNDEVDKATQYDVSKILSVSPKGQNITIKRPARAEAKTYWKQPLH